MAKEKVYVLEVNEEKYSVAEERLLKAASILTDRYAQWLGLQLPKLETIQEVFVETVNKEANLIEDNIRNICACKLEVPKGINKTLYASLVDLPEGTSEFIADQARVKVLLNNLIKGNGITNFLSVKGDKVVLDAAGKKRLKDKHSVTTTKKVDVECYNDITHIVDLINKFREKYGSSAFKNVTNVAWNTDEYSTTAFKVVTRDHKF
ncbi:MAG: hypothetical protein AAF655_12525 [Bacteroidota bacterium]